jgi:hypothetical protein
VGNDTVKIVVAVLIALVIAQLVLPRLAKLTSKVTG